MRQAFIIMQIGNGQLEEICEKAIVPALKACDFDAKRVDKHNMGGLLKSEIVGFIASSDIIVADLTNERPNCYLEVGYAMGLNKFRNLVLTAREDHNPDSANYKKGGPKIHFDLAGYDILFWDPNSIEDFRIELEKRVRRRMATLPGIEAAKPWDNEWIQKNQDIAFAGLKRNNLTGFMEIRMSLVGIKIHIDPDELLPATHRSQIPTFGWPLGAMDSRNKEFMPKPTPEGIYNELDFRNGESYDYWTIKRDGSFYLLKSLFEDKRKPGHIFFNTRIVRITETLLYSVRLYSSLKVPIDSHFLLGIRHGGLKDRILTAVAGRELTMLEDYKSSVDEVNTEIEVELGKIESNLVDIVEKFTKPLFEVFDYFKLDKKVLEDIVDNFVKGKVT